MKLAVKYTGLKQLSAGVLAKGNAMSVKHSVMVLALHPLQAVSQPLLLIFMSQSSLDGSWEGG